nr:PIN domain-containing protein [Pseudomonas sp.]
MTMILVDTSVWIDHFRSGNPSLAELLELDSVLVHPLIIAEIACGTPPDRATTLSSLGLLQQAQQASIPEVIRFIDREKLYGLGCGIVDMVLLASTLVTPGAQLWTLDKRLAALANRFSVQHTPALP